MKIASSTPDGRTHLLTEEDVDLADLPGDEPVPARLLNRDGDGVPRLRETRDVRNIIARNPYFGEPADADLEELLEAAETPGDGQIEIGEVPELVAQKFTD
jgi:hypothetical protein